MYICLTGSHPFDPNGCATDDEIREILVKLYSDKTNQTKLMNECVFDQRTERLSESCLEIMRQMLHPDPEQRPTSEKFLLHPWTQGLTASWETMATTHADLKAFWQNKFRTGVLTKFNRSLGRSREKVSEEEVEQMFKALDIKKNGVLDLDEIAAAFKGLGISEKYIRSIFAAVDVENSGYISFDAFRSIFVQTRTV